MVTTLDALCLSGSAVTNQHVTVKRGVNNGTRGLAKPFIYLPDQQQDSEGQANGLLIPRASHDQRKARWEKTKPWVALGRAVGWALWLIVGWEVGQGVGGGRAELSLKSIQNPDSMWHRLMRVSVLILSKNAPITRTRTLSELWLCIWGKRKNPLVWDDLRLRRRDRTATTCQLAAEWC